MDKHTRMSNICMYVDLHDVNISKSKWSTRATRANEVTEMDDYCLGSYMEIEEITTLQAKSNCNCRRDMGEFTRAFKGFSTNLETTI